jgi:hypothetical protein
MTRYLARIASETRSVEASRVIAAAAKAPFLFDAQTQAAFFAGKVPMIVRPEPHSPPEYPALDCKWWLEAMHRYGEAHEWPVKRSDAEKTDGTHRNE